MKDETYSKIEKFVETFWEIVNGTIFALFLVIAFSLGILMLSAVVIGFFTSIITSQIVVIIVSIVVILAVLTVGVLTIIVVNKKNRERKLFYY